MDMIYLEPFLYMHLFEWLF